jgi:hypothetical protein
MCRRIRLLAWVAVALGLAAHAQAESFLAYVAGNVRFPLLGRDANGYIYIAGVASSTGFRFPDRIPPCPAPPCRDETPTRAYDVVVFKLDPSVKVDGTPAEPLEFTAWVRP